MTRPRLLYLSVNDGTDTRIAKEIATLIRSFDITFVGVRQEDNGPNRLPAGVRQVVLAGRRRDPLTLLRLAREVCRLGPGRFDSVHVVNENLLFTLAPLLLASRNVVLDVFDSMFLKNSLLIRTLRWPMQWFAHALADTVLVTDEDRRRLVPALIRGNVRVLPNYPGDPGVLPPRRLAAPGDALRIFFSGSLASGRGIPFLDALLDADPTAEIIVAGWIYDDAARRLCARGRVSYRGVVTQAEAAALARECDYILCLYSPDVPNNIHASPNKIYDAALLGVPVIINAEVRASALVRAEGLGYVLPSYGTDNIPGVLAGLRSGRGGPTKASVNPAGPRWAWSAVEHELLEAHVALP